MQQKHYQQKRGVFYCLSPILIYWGVNFVIGILFGAVLIFSLMRDPSISSESQLMETYLQYVLQANTKLTILTSGLTLAITGIIFYTRDRKEHDLLYQRHVGVKGTAGLLCASLGLHTVVNIVFIILMAVSSTSLKELITQHDETMQLLNSGNLLLDILSVGILASICEEIVFRGLFFNRLRSLMPENRAILLSAVVFGCMHFTSVLQMAYAVAIGYLLAYAYSKYETILAPVLIHMCFNLVNFIVDNDFFEMLIQNKIGALVYYAAGVALTIVGVKIIKNKKKPPLLTQGADSGAE